MSYKYACPSCNRQFHYAKDAQRHTVFVEPHRPGRGRRSIMMRCMSDDELKAKQINRYINVE